MAASSNGVFYFDDNLKVIETYVVPNSLSLLQAKPVKGTNKTILLFLSPGEKIFLEIFDHTNGSFTYDGNGLEVTDKKDGYHDVYDEAGSVQLLNVGDDAIMIVYGRKWSNGSDQVFKKYDYYQLLAGKGNNALLFATEWTGYKALSLNVGPNGLLRGVNAKITSDDDRDYRGLTFFSVDANMNTEDGFVNTLVTKKYSAENNPVSGPRYARKLGNHTVIMGRGMPTMGIDVTVIALFDYDWNFVGYYKLKNDNEIDEFKHGAETMTSRICGAHCDGDYETSNSWPWLPHPDAPFSDNFENSFDIEIINDYEYMILTSNSLKKVNIKNTSACTLKTENSNPAAIAAEQARLMAELEAADEPVDDALDKDNEITIVNDLSASVQRNGRNDVIVQLNGGKYGNDEVLGRMSVIKGNYIRISCDVEELIIKDGTYVLHNLKDYCGRTIRLSSIW